MRFVVMAGEAAGSRRCWRGGVSAHATDPPQ